MPQTKLAWVCLQGTHPTLNGDVAVYDMDKEKIMAITSVGIEPRYLAWFPTQSKVYVTNYGSNTVSVIQSDTLSVSKTIPVGAGPNAIILDNQRARGYVANFDGHSISVLDLHQDEVLSTIAVGINPIGITLSKDGQKLYITLQGENALVIIDTDQNQVLTTLPLGSQPNDLVQNVDGTLLFVVLSGENRISVFDPVLNQELASIPVGHNPQRIALHPSHPLAYVTNLDENSLSIISTQDYQVQGTIPDLIAPFDFILTDDGSQLWFTNEYQLTLIDTEKLKVKSTHYAPPSLQTRQGIIITESLRKSSRTEVFPIPTNSPRPYSFVTEKISFKAPKPFETNLHIEFPTPTAQAEKLTLSNAEVKAPSISILPMPSRPNYYYLTFALRIPYRITYKDDHNQTQELQDALHHVLPAVEIHLTPGRIGQNLNLKVTTQSEMISKSAPRPNSLALTLRTQVIALHQVHISE